MLPSPATNTYSTMSATSTQPHPLASIVKYSKTLATLLRRAKSSPATQIDIVHDVEDAVSRLVGEFSRPPEQQGSSPACTLPEESVVRFLKKVQGTLEEFIKVDFDKKQNYDILVSKVSELLEPAGRDQSSSAPASSSVLSSTSSTDPLGLSLALFNCSEDEFQAGYRGIGDTEKRCLSCFTLFPPDVVVKKRELTHCWIGMGLIEDDDSMAVAGDVILNRLVLKGLIERVVEKKRFCGRYMMHKSVRDKMLMITESVEDPGDDQYGSWSIIMHKPHDSSRSAGVGVGVPKRPPVVRTHTMNVGGPQGADYSVAQDQAGNIEVLLNVKQTALNEKRFESVMKMKNLRVLHLGTWRDDPENYIVAEGIDDEAFKDLGKVKSLSPQGVSGIVKLPDSVYSMYELKVLDLRACHNLESINAEKIVSLARLTHLDLSGCYLLDHIPKAITALTELQVLKGFVINPLPQVQKKGNGNPESEWPCAFRDLAKLKKLVKLTVRTRKLSFPTAYDLGTLCELDQLCSLRIAWAGSSNDGQTYGGIGSVFPKNLRKLELQAAHEGAASRLLALLSTAGDNCLEKLYIRGGGLSDLSTEKHQLPKVKVLRLKYLPKLHVDWVKFRKSFSGLRHLEIWGCPNLVFFPCNSNGVWESTQVEDQPLQ